VPHQLWILVSLAGWLCIVKLVSLESHHGGAFGWLTIGFGLYLLLAGGHLEDVRDGGIAYATNAVCGYAWYRVWGKKKFALESAAEQAALANKHDWLCEGGSCVPDCPRKPNRIRRDARNEEERRGLRSAQSIRDRAEVAAELEEERLVGESGRAQNLAKETGPVATATTQTTGASRLPELIYLESPAIAAAAKRLSGEDLDATLERVRVLYHQHKSFVSELIHRDPRDDEKLARAEQGLTEYGAVFHALVIEQRRRRATSQ
jgi:hypothetical protein